MRINVLAGRSVIRPAAEAASDLTEFVKQLADCGTGGEQPTSCISPGPGFIQ